MPGRLIGTVTIQSTGPNNTPAVSVGHTADQFPARHVGITAPGSLSSTVTVEVDATSTGSWVALTDGGSDVTIGAGKAIQIRNFPFPRLRLASSTGEASDRTFRVWLQ